VTPLDWALVALGALLVGLGKGGLVGAGNLTVVIFAMVFEPRASVGLLLPVLIAADLVAVTVYRPHVNWSSLWRILPWMFAGVLAGYFLFGALSDAAVRRCIGAIVLAMTLIQAWRTLAARTGWADFADRMPHTLGFRALLGSLGGFATMVANAAGPVVNLYFISVGLPKMAFIGTGAWCFFIVTVVQVPLQAHLGIIHLGSLRTSLARAPAAMLGAWIAPRLVVHIPQRLFSWAVWTLIVLAGMNLAIF